MPTGRNQVETGNRKEDEIMEPIDKIVDHWREQLLLDEWRETYDAMTDEQKKIVRLALRYPSGKEIDELGRQVVGLGQDLAAVRSIFPWHRGDEGSPDVPVLQPRYDRLRKRVEELEEITKWKLHRMASDTDYLPFVDEHYWYEPERGPVVYAGEANLLERRIVELESRIELLESDMKSGDYETLYAETSRDLQDANVRIAEMSNGPTRIEDESREGTTVWLWKHNLSEVTTRDMTGDPNWIAAEVYYSLNDSLLKDE